MFDAGCWVKLDAENGMVYGIGFKVESWKLKAQYMGDKLSALLVSYA